MKEYTGFAAVYDMFMDNVPYDKWAGYLHKLLKSYGVKDGIVLELGCGTGRMTRIFRSFGYDMIGVDISEDMLRIASEQEKDGVAGEILYLNQDMREFELYGTVAAVYCVCDGMNYITDKDDLLKVFKLVNNYLDPGGVFIFDMNTPYYYKKILGERTICENRDEGSFIWENYFDADTKINEFDITLYIRRDSKKDSSKKTKKNEESMTETYEKFEETHFQRAYSISEVKGLLKKAGLTDIKVYKAMTKEAPDAKTERVYFAAKEHGKKTEK